MPTGAFLIERRGILHSCCSVCGSAEDSDLHILFDCLYASSQSRTHLKSSTRPSLYVGLMPMTGTVTFLVVRMILISSLICLFFCGSFGGIGTPCFTRRKANQPRSFGRRQLPCFVTVSVKMCSGLRTLGADSCRIGGLFRLLNEIVMLPLLLKVSLRGAARARSVTC